MHFLEKSLSYVDTLALLAHVNVLAAPSGADYTPRIPMDALLMGSRVVANAQNFNELYKEYCSLVPLSGYRAYNHQGYNDNTRSLQGAKNIKQYGVPDSQKFAAALVHEILHGKSRILPNGLFSTEGFVTEFGAAFESIS